MMWVLVCAVLLAVGGLLTWAAVRQGAHGGDRSIEEAKLRAYRDGAWGENSGI